MDIDVEGGTFRGDLFIARDIPVDALVITEGSLLIVEPDEIMEIEPRLTPTTARFALKAYFDKIMPPRRHFMRPWKGDRAR